MPEPRRYQLQNAAANRLIGELLEAAGVPPDRRSYYQQMLTTVLKMHEDGALTGDLKITNAALKELRYAYKVFAPYRAVRKVTVFGSARTAPTDAAAVVARDFGRRMVEEGWMVSTGAGAGIMGAAQEGAGGERSFGLNIRLPFEQEANPWIAEDPKLITFKYFFTRKLFLVKEANALALLPGGFGTMDESYEALTLMQTGKATIIPVVMIEAGPKPYWRIWDRWNAATLVERRLVNPDDTAFYRVVDTVEDAIREITGFYRVFHSSRIVGDVLVFRLTKKLDDRQVAELQQAFEDILKAPIEQAAGPITHELTEFPELPRLIVPFNRSGYGRLRLLIDHLNSF
ncbi:MAG: TIGR00730 family Rossman fold protein [Candidatus Rokubacteria bacterium]|nr:TIGR00730 family Rossman fold protein [Candidatus Rokubacteria bacterium]